MWVPAAGARIMGASLGRFIMSSRRQGWDSQECPVGRGGSPAVCPALCWGQKLSRCVLLLRTWCLVRKTGFISSPKVIKGSPCAGSVCRCCGFPGWCSRGMYLKIKSPEEDSRLGEHVSGSDRGKGALRRQLEKGTKGWAWAGGWGGRGDCYQGALCEPQFLPLWPDSRQGNLSQWISFFCKMGTRETTQGN